MTKFWMCALLMGGMVISTQTFAQEESAPVPVNELGNPVQLEGPLDNPDDMDEVNTEIDEAEDYIIIVDEPADITDGQREFALSFAAASRAGEMRNLWALVHPDSRACLSDAEKLFIEQENFAYLLDEPIESVKMTQVNRVLEGDVRAMFAALYGNTVTLPVVPTHSLQIDYVRDNGACAPITTSRFVFLREIETDEWREVMPCNTTFPVTAAEAATFKAAHEAEIDTVFAALDEETKARFREQVRAGEIVSVTKEIAALTERDLSLSRGVAQEFCFK